MFYHNNFLVAAGLRLDEDKDSARSKLRKSWKGDMSSSRFADTLWKEYNKSGAEKRADTLKNAPMSRALAEKPAAKKRPTRTSEAPPHKKAKGFTAKKKKSTRPVPKVVIDIPAKEELTAKEELPEIGTLALLFARSMITEDWARELRKENKKLVQDVTEAADHAQFSMAEQEVLHQQSKLAWEKRSADLESQNKTYLLQLTEMLDERASLERFLMDERNSVMTVAAEFYRENLVLKVKNQALRAEVAATVEAAKEAMNNVIDTSKNWAVHTFEMMAEEEDIPRYVHRREFQESLHKANIKGEEPPVFQESSEDEEEEDVEAQEEEDNSHPDA
ncbi:uncharacterized protein LOC130589494 [Beta vulgaris subsp. vulgaris]|uniref:uncharacterized protein LOC130589494 n=1 Tax=Beta vulgaris subsp. vulgaris TaxID=3555 RepID=UPI00254813CA|nr:uncharacterized protein LOC130589494 [Beta vulgaris subsp. vulgaris]